MYSLEEVNNEIRKQKARERSQEWRKNNKEKKKQQNAEWNAKKGVEYQRAYYIKVLNKNITP
jgi:hypothetical protein